MRKGDDPPVAFRLSPPTHYPNNGDAKKSSPVKLKHHWLQSQKECARPATGAHPALQPACPPTWKTAARNLRLRAWESAGWSPIRIENQMHHRVVQRECVKGDPGAKHRRKIHDRTHAVHVQQGSLSGRLSSMNCEVTDLHLKPERDHVKTA